MRVNVPSERNFEVFHAVETAHLSRREAARRFAISPAEIERIVAEVKVFLAQHGSTDALEVPPEKLELVSLRMCYERLSYFYKLLMRKYNAIESEWMPPNQVRLLLSAARLSVEQTKIAARIGKVQQAMIEAGTLTVEPHEYVYEQDDGESAEPVTDEHIAPPDRGCTDFDAPMTEEEEQAFLRVVAKLGPNPSSEEFRAEVMRELMALPREKTSVQFGPNGQAGVGMTQ